MLTEDSVFWIVTDTFVVLVLVAACNDNDDGGAVRML
jgi:hypothetical protein